MKREFVIAGAVIAALATAALVRPPRAAPAFAPVVTVSAAPHSAVMVSPSTPLRAAQGRLQSNHHRYRARGQQSQAHAKSDARHHRVPPPVIDLNRADVAELARIPGVSQDLARRIVAYRDLVGGFASLDDLSDLDGLSESRLTSLGRYLVVR